MTILLLKGNHEISILNLAHSTEKYPEGSTWIEINPITTQCDLVQNGHNSEKKSYQRIPLKISFKSEGYNRFSSMQKYNITIRTQLL